LGKRARTDFTCGCCIRYEHHEVQYGARALSRLRGLLSLALLIGTVLAVFYWYGPHNPGDLVRRIPVHSVALASLAILLNVVFAAIRLRYLLRDSGHDLRMVDVLKALSGGSLGALFFFQIAGQLAARGLIMARSGVRFEIVLTITIVERVIAALMSAAFAVTGALYIFGGIYFRLDAGGAYLLKVAAGLAIAFVMAAALGFGRKVRAQLSHYLTVANATRWARISALTAAAQIPMMAAYVVLGSGLSPNTPLMSLAAASGIVMFAASMPVSFSGWGVREFSSVLALGAIGFGAVDALTVGLLVGIIAALQMGLVFALTSSQLRPSQPVSSESRAFSQTYFDALG